MTQVYLEQNGKQYTVRCQGHATGSPAVCAAVSCLIYTLAGWLCNAAVVVDRQQLSDANADIVFSGGSAAETAFDLICIGFLQLAQEYKEYICVDFQIV